MASVSRGRTIVIAHERILPGPVSLVWELLTDWEHQGDWMLEAHDFVVTSSHREGVGVEAEATIRIAGIRTRDPIRVLEWEPNQLLVMAHVGWVKGVGTLSLTPFGPDATLLLWKEELEPPLGALGFLGMTLFKPLMSRVFARDLRVLESLVRVASRARAPRARKKK